VTLFYCRLHESVLQSLFTLSTDPPMSCLGAVLWCLLVSKAGCWLTDFSCHFRQFATGSVTNLTLDYVRLCSWSKSSQSHIAPDGQSVSKSWYRAPCGAHDQIFISSAPGCPDPLLNRYMRNKYSTPCFTVYLPSQRVGYLGDVQQLTVFVATEISVPLVHCVVVDLFTSCCIAASITFYLVVA
jgi:hypothetical protein